MGERDAIAEIRTLAAANGRLRGLHDALAMVQAFREAYAEDIFPWPQESPSSDAIAARMGRHVCDQLSRQLREAIEADESGEVRDE